MRPVENTAPAYTIIWPNGTKLQWMNKNRITEGEIIVVTGHSSGCRGCRDCDGVQYLDSHNSPRCHYRSPESIFGLCYWRKVD